MRIAWGVRGLSHKNAVPWWKLNDILSIKWEKGFNITADHAVNIDILHVKPEETPTGMLL